jgi:hypothetical protein
MMMKYYYNNGRLNFENDNSLLSMGYIGAGDFVIELHNDLTTPNNKYQFVVSEDLKELYKYTTDLYNNIISTSKTDNDNMELITFNDNELTIRNYELDSNTLVFKNENNVYIFEFCIGKESTYPVIRINIPRIWGKALYYALALIEYYRELKNNLELEETSKLIKK